APRKRQTDLRISSGAREDSPEIAEQIMPAGNTSVDPRPESVPWRADFGPAGPLRMNQPSLRDRHGVDYGEEQNVQKLHAAIRHEQRGGLVTIKPFSLRMLVIWGSIFFFAGFFLARHGADFNATNGDRGNPPAAQSNPQAVQTGTASASAVQSKVADANAPLVVHVAMKNMKF